MKEKLPVIYNTVENMFLFAITDIDTQRNLSEFFGKTKISRIQKSGTPKGKPDVQEVEIELIDDNIIKMLEIGNHVTYMPKDKGTLYVGYTRYPDVPKTEEGYIRQGRDTENGFIRFKQNLLKSKVQKRVKKYQLSTPPQYLYYGIGLKFLKYVTDIGLALNEGSHYELFKNQKNALKSSSEEEGEITVIVVSALKMNEDGYKLYIDNNGLWYTEEIPKEYINIISNNEELK